jgi:hypothetical protein
MPARSRFEGNCAASSILQRAIGNKAAQRMLRTYEAIKDESTPCVGRGFSRIPKNNSIIRRAVQIAEPYQVVVRAHEVVNKKGSRSREQNN